MTYGFVPDGPPAFRLETRGMAPPALNEMLRMGSHHMSAHKVRKKVMEDLWLLTWSQNREAIQGLRGRALKGPFAVGYLRRHPGLFDLDNLAASPKLLFDTLVDNHVLHGDQRSVLNRWAYIDDERVAPGDEGYLLELFWL